MDAATDAARRAFAGPWSELSATERGGMLARLAAALDARAEEFARAETAQNGEDLAESESTHETAALPRPPAYGRADPGPERLFLYTRREPVGVCGLIVPWNFPLAIAVWKLAPALAAGCTVVLKPASDTPVTALLLSYLAEEAGSSGVVNCVTGPGHRLVTHPASTRYRSPARRSPAAT